MKYAKRMSYLKASEIREILKVTQQPDIISFAGGLPAPELFPVKDILTCSTNVLQEHGQQALQYSTTEGVPGLRKWVANRMNQQLQTTFSMDDILITHGSQQALDLSGKVFLDEGDVVLCECPTYLAALSAFRCYGCEFKEIDTDEDGMNMEYLQKVLEMTPNCKLIYVIPDFQNPTGRTWSIERRKRLVQLATQYDVMILEDNPYGELRYEGEHLPSIKSFDEDGHVLCCGTFSKIFCPGYRIGWIAGREDIIRQFVTVKQGADLQCNTLAQMEILTYMETFDIDAHIQKILKLYHQRRDLALATMDANFPASVRYTRPHGGLFCWVSLPNYLDANEILNECLQRKVAFVPGASFFANEPQKNHFRINFSNMSEERIVTGIQILAEVLHDAIDHNTKV